MSGVLQSGWPSQPIVALLIIIILTTAVSCTVDEDILNAGGLDALAVFHVSRDSRVMLREGLDMMTPLSDFTEMLENSTKSKRNLKMSNESRWPGVIPYEITSRVSSFRRVIEEAMSEYVKYTCIRFEEKSSVMARIKFFREDGCWSNIGYLGYTTNELSLETRCRKKYTLLHEIGHALGLSHEHKRFDRDKYIKVDRKKVDNAQFRKASETVYTSLDIEYDYRSIMHYHYWLDVRDSRYRKIVGNVQNLSFRDIKVLNLAYNCAEKGNCENTCPFNGFVLFQPLNGQPACTCWCDSGDIDNEDPLVLCSSLTQSREPVYNLRGESSLLEAEEAEDCIDLLDNCTRFREDSLCFTALVKMKELCAKTCKFCGKGLDLCMDNDESCAIMAEAGVCEDRGLEELMDNLCPKSCGKCTQPHSDCDIQRAMEAPDTEVVNSATINGQWMASFIVYWANSLLLIMRLSQQ